MSATAFSGPKLRIVNAAKVYNARSGDLLAVDRCSLDVKAGEIVSIVGPSGCGKTTLLWSMSGLHLDLDSIKAHLFDQAVPASR